MTDYFRVTIRMHDTTGQRAAVRNRKASRGPTSTTSEALILADQILNRLNGYARKGSRTRKDSYQRDLNWLAEVLLRVQASDRDPLRPTGQ